MFSFYSAARSFQGNECLIFIVICYLSRLGNLIWYFENTCKNILGIKNFRWIITFDYKWSQIYSLSLSSIHLVGFVGRRRRGRLGLVMIFLYNVMPLFFSLNAFSSYFQDCFVSIDRLWDIFISHSTSGNSSFFIFCLQPFSLAIKC